jgi:chitin disaccharide deacetylase
MQSEACTKIVVCADDYALTPGVSRAIRELIAAGRISATSVMTVCPYWPEEGPELAAVAGEADIGLHLTLTDQAPLGPMAGLAPAGRLPPIGKMVRASLLGQLPIAEIEAEIDRQVVAFVAVWGRMPDHVDGHHHVHQLPGVRSALLRVLARQGGPRPYLRSCYEPPGRVIARGIARRKALMISALGTRFTRAAAANGFVTNGGFSGIYDLAADTHRLDDLFARFVRHLGPMPLAMCHPGYSDTTLEGLDLVTTQRDAERVFLAGEEWVETLAAANVEVAPFKALQAAGASWLGQGMLGEER